ncbi:MAG TPA: response regulator transcription factor [Candidatus Acidoferrales bacterium]|jgi:two-component system invasion response regulator UvrY|nr:response regulator transcription factor [Candidatus Acidoferrales bacterium]
MRILIADDHAVFRRGLRETLAEAFSRVTYGEAKTAEETVDCVRRQDWDVVILDISMPGKSGLDILDDVKRLRPRTPVLLLTMHPEQQYARRALKAGAAGYLTKDSVPDELKVAIKRIVAGGRYVSATLAEKLAVDLRKGADIPLHELLSDREFQVLRMIASGKTVKEMAEELSLSVKTVSTYRGRILEKTSMKTNAELIRYALESQLVD